MATVTFTLTDTPAGGVALHTDFKPAAGNPATPAQSTAMEIIARTRKQWVMEAVELNALAKTKAQQTKGTFDGKAVQS